MPKIREPLKKFGRAIKNRLTRTEVPVPGSQRDTQEFGDNSGNSVRKIPTGKDPVYDSYRQFRKQGGTPPKGDYNLDDKMPLSPKKRQTSDGYMKVRIN